MAKEDKKLKLYHGTNAEFDEFDPRKSGGLVSFVEEPYRGQAGNYAAGGGGQRKRLPDKDKFLIDHNEGHVYELDPEKKTWSPVGKADPEQLLVRKENLIPFSEGEKKPPQLTYDELSEMADDYEGRGKLPEGFDLSPKSARILEREFEDLKILDTTTRGGIEKIASLPKGKHSRINNLIDYAARDLEDGPRHYGDVRGYNFGNNFWSTTKYGKSHEEALSEGLIKKLQPMGYEGIRHHDDSHPTVAVFGDVFKPEYQVDKKLKSIFPGPVEASNRLPFVRKLLPGIAAEMGSGALRALPIVAAGYAAYDMATGGDPLSSELAGEERGGEEDQYNAARKGAAEFYRKELARKLQEDK